MQEVIGSTPIFSTEGVNEDKKPNQFPGWAFCLLDRLTTNAKYPAIPFQLARTSIVHAG